MCLRDCVAGIAEFGKPKVKPIVTKAPVVDGTCPCKLADLQREDGKCHVLLASCSEHGPGRHENQDRCIQMHATSTAVPFHLVGVMDGHDTSFASQTTSELLPPLLSKHLVDGHSVADANSMALAGIESRLEKSKCTSGTCVVCCTVAGRYVWCSNLGDCRAALVQLQAPAGERGVPRPERLCWMSQDQKASDPDEQRRIERAGGHVKLGRIEGLEPSRTLGDFDVKSRVPKGTISIEPEVRQLRLGDGSHAPQAVLICGSDGLWDVVRGEDLCNMIQQSQGLGALLAQLRDGLPPAGDAEEPVRRLAEGLVRLARRRGSRDDCTAAVALISVS